MRRRRGAMVAAVAVLVLLASSCQIGVWQGPPTATHVSVIGDSLVWQAEGNVTFDTSNRYLADELAAAGYRSHVTSWIGATIDFGHQTLWPAVSDDPDLDILVIALGTNDAHDGVALATSKAQLDAWLDEVAPRLGCVALVGLDEQAWGWGLDVTGPPFNAMLANEAATRDHVLYVAWDRDPALLNADGDVHLHTPEAQAAYRTLLHGAVDRCAATMT